MNTYSPEYYMLQALQLAERGRYTTSPNPMVGCIIVKNNKIIGSGFHVRAGEAHAEIHALSQAGNEAQDATMYVTLEPCCHYGRTPPCVNELIKAKIKKIYIATKDPNPIIAGKSIKLLQAANIQVEIGLCEQQAKQLNEIYFHFIQHRRPFVIAKWAMSLDGKTITHSNDDRNITSSKTQQSAHAIRHSVDAILIGARTAIIDNPLLTIRHSDQPITKQPIRIILSSNNNLPQDLKLFSQPGKTIIVTAKKKHINPRENVEIIIMPTNSNGNIHLSCLLDELGKRNITSLLIEGGMHTHEAFFNENLVNKVHVYIAPVIIGKMPKKKNMLFTQWNAIHQDFHLIANREDQ